MLNIRRSYLFFASSIIVSTWCYAPGRTQPTINDFSSLNETCIHGIKKPKNSTELADILAFAHDKNLKVALSGVRHSQGGHSFYENALVVSLENMNKVVSLKGHLLTVQAGITWKEVQAYVNPRNLAVKIMQFANVFTVGGSLSVNANGIDPHCGPLIESVHSLKIMCADGTIVTASRTENEELFRLAIGGYGLFGVIIEVTLEVVENILYKKEVERLSIDEYIASIKRLTCDTSIGFHFGQITLTAWGKTAFSGIKSIMYRKIDVSSFSDSKIKRLKELTKERFIGLKRIMLSFVRRSSLLRAFQRDIDMVPNGALISRNNIMSPHVSHLHHYSSRETDLLQEYFIPVDNLKPFLAYLEFLMRAVHINLINVHVRYVPQNTENVLSYVRKNSMGVVIFFSQKRTEEEAKKTELWTRLLIDKAHKLEGTYYLPTQLHATKDQLKKMYPAIDACFKAKKQYDPQELFINSFYKKYA